MAFTTVIDFLSITPEKLTIYPRFFKDNEKTMTHEERERLLALLHGYDRVKNVQPKNLQNNRHNFELSPSAAKNLQKKVSWLYYYAKTKTVVTRKGKQLTNLKLNFATLKLPSEQIHSSDFITKNCLNQLLVELKKKYNLTNYVWRLEYQKNGNLHYHIVTDTYIDYHGLNRSWNRILNKYGYVDAYTRKFSQMSLSDYVRTQSDNGKTDFATLAKRYAKGCASRWREPNSVDTKAVFGKNNIGAYISKYMAKNDQSTENKKLPIYEANSANSRLWYCSQSLAKLDCIKDAREAFELDFYGILLEAEGTFKVVHEYCQVLYFKLSKMSSITRSVMSTLFETYRRTAGYLPA